MSDLLLENYFYYIKDEKKLAKNTVDAYARDLAQFRDYLGENSKYNLFNTNKTVIITYLSYLQRNEKSISTISRALSSLRSLYQYLLNNSLIIEDPTFNLKSPQSERKLPNFLNENEIDLLLSQTSMETQKGIRDRGMLELMYFNGLRVSEVIDLNIVDIDFNSGLIKLSKDNKNRVIALNKKAYNTIIDYLQQYRTNYSEDEPLFTNLNGLRLTRQGIWKIFKEYNRMAGLDEDTTPHTLRHSFAIHMLNNGTNLRKLQKIMGYGDLTAIQNYMYFANHKCLEVEDGS